MTTPQTSSASQAALATAANTTKTAIPSRSRVVARNSGSLGPSGTVELTGVSRIAVCIGTSVSQVEHCDHACAVNEVAGAAKLRESRALGSRGYF